MESGHIRISISKTDRVRDIESAFGLIYPYLKVEFYKIEEGTGAIRSIRVEPNTLLNTFTNIIEHQKVNISNDRTVAQLTHDFENVLGTIVKVSRKSGNVWIAISITEGWTLESQNSAGKNISNEMALPN